jgi:hypothetical protein
MYVRWVNYEEWRAAADHSDDFRRVDGTMTKRKGMH